MTFRVDTPPRGTDELVPNERLRALKATIEARHLPVRERFEELVQHIVRQIESGQEVVVFEGETGSGKSVYGPAAVREALRRTGCLEKIVVMEPRKDAAVGVATATAAIQDTYLGGEVGYATSEGSQRSHETLTHVVTSGIAVRYLLSGKADRDKIGAIIIDEVHERTIETDLALGQLKRMREERRSPLVVLMSATADHVRLARHFSLDESASIKIEGRAYPVEVSHTEENEGESSEEERRDYLQQTVQAALNMLTDLESDGGDVLAFLPGEPEIHDCINRLRSASGFPAEEVEVFGLYGLMKPADRQHVLQGRGEGGKRRVIFATNIAESSVTVPGVTTVIDTGRMRIVRFDEKDGIKKREDVWISKESALQRAGRAGRESPGKCVRLYSKHRFEQMAQHPTPSILLEKPSRLVLQLRCYGVDELTFPYYEAPNEAKLRQAHDELMLLGLIDRDGNVTDLGRRVERLPFEPRIGMLLLECEKRRCFEAGLILAAASRETRIFAPPSREQQGLGRRDAQREIRQLHEREGMIIPSSDWFTTLEVFNRAIDEGVFYVSTIVSKPPHHQTPAERLAAHKFYDWANELHLNPHALLHIAKRIKDYASDYYRFEDEELAKDERRRFHVEDFCRALEEEDGRNHPKDVSIAIGLSHKDQLYYCDGMGFRPLDGPETSARPVTHPSSATFSPGGDRRPFVAVATVEVKDDPRTFYKKAWAKQIHKLPLAVLQEVAPERLRTRTEQQNHPWNGTSITTTYTEIVGNNGANVLETEVKTEKTAEDPRSWVDKCEVYSDEEFRPEVKAVLAQNAELAEFLFSPFGGMTYVLRNLYLERYKAYPSELAVQVSAIRRAELLSLSVDDMLEKQQAFSGAERVSVKTVVKKSMEMLGAWRFADTNMHPYNVRVRLLGLLATFASCDAFSREICLTQAVVKKIQDELRSLDLLHEDKSSVPRLEEVFDTIVKAFEDAKRFYQETQPHLIRRLEQWDRLLKESGDESNSWFRLRLKIEELRGRLLRESRLHAPGTSLRVANLPEYENEYRELEENLKQQIGLDLPPEEEEPMSDVLSLERNEKKKAPKKEQLSPERQLMVEVKKGHVLLALFNEVAIMTPVMTQRPELLHAAKELRDVIRDGRHKLNALLQERAALSGDSGTKTLSLADKMRDLVKSLQSAFKKRQNVLFPGSASTILTEISNAVVFIDEALPTSEAQAFIDAGEIQQEAFEQKLYERIAEVAIKCLKTKSTFAIDAHQLITETLNTWK